MSIAIALLDTSAWILRNLRDTGLDVRGKSQRDAKAAMQERNVWKDNEGQD